MADKETTLLARWIYDTLTGDSSVETQIGKRVYRSVIPQGATPAPSNNKLLGVLFVRQGGLTKRGGFAEKLYVKQRYQIKAVCTGDSYTPCNTLASDIERLFGNIVQQPYGSSLHIISSMSVDDVEYTETDQDIRYNHYGGIYEVQAYLL